MAPLLKSLYRPSQRSLLSSLFTATFLGAFVVVAFPCPVRPLSNISNRAEARLDDGSGMNGTDDLGSVSGSGRGYRLGHKSGQKGEVVVMMNKRGRRFMEES